MLVNLTPGSCGQNMQPNANSQGYSFDTVSAFPHGIPLTTSNTVTLSGLVDQYGGFCFGPAEGNASGGYIGVICNSGQWYIYSVLGLGTGSPVVGKQLATGSYPWNGSTSYQVSLAFGSGTGELTVTFTQGSASPLTQSFSTGQFTPTAVGYAMESADTTYTNDVTIGGLTYTTG
jgi:hypothetical protein